MLKRIIAVAAFTGTSHAISLITISYVLRNLGEEITGMMGLVDSTILVMAVVISFGIQLSVNRNVATQTTWRSNYRLAQSARIVVGLLIIGFGVISYLLQKDITKYIYLAAPLIALNGDYALYGNGKPVHAAMLSFFRVAIPNMGILIASQFVGTNVIYVYMVLAGTGIFIAGMLAAYFNKVKYFFPPRSDFYKFYMKYYKVGLFQIAAVLMITGMLTVAKGFYPVAIIGLVYGGLKYFEVFKGGLRILVQAFFKELTIERVNMRIDKTGMIAGALVSIPFLIYPKTTLSIIYGDAYIGYEAIIIIFGAAMLVATLSTSAGTFALLKKYDNLNLFAYLTSLGLSILTMIVFSYTQQLELGIPLAILAGEVCLITILGTKLGGFKYFLDRFKFLLKLLPPILIAIGLKFVLINQLHALVISAAIFAVSVLYFFRKIIFEPIQKN
jgi:hypothetical protein